MKKVLYFEGAGMEVYEKGSNVGNYRIRTSFLNNEGEHIYLELSGVNHNNKKAKLFGWKTYIDHVFNISISTDENESRISVNTKTIDGYSKDSIINWINQNLNCSFEDMEILDRMEDYSVHGGYKNGEYIYNLMDNHTVNEARTKARKEAFNKVDVEYRTGLDEKYSKISLVSIDPDSITIKCFASETALQKAGLERTRVIPVIY